MAGPVTQEATDNVEDDDITIITVLSKGNTISYVTPSFPVYSANLVEVKIQYQDEAGNLQISDAFAKDCDDMDYPLPAFSKLKHG